MAADAKIIAATLLHPSDPSWPACKSAASEWADEHVVLQDRKGDAFGNESAWREELWRMAMEKAERNDWIFILDSDFILTFDPHDLVESEAAGWKFKLYDLWNAKQYRDDVFWKAHKFPRPWMFAARASPSEPLWNGRGIHTGHCPRNYPNSFSYAPSDYCILHLGWATPQIRELKFARYDALNKQLTEYERKHLASVLDNRPLLVDLPVEWRQKYSLAAVCAATQTF